MSWEARQRRQRERLGAMWNPHSPDNMLVRHQALEAGKADSPSFPAHQKRIGVLARKTRRLQSQGLLREPTDAEVEMFTAVCLNAGLTPPWVGEDGRCDEAEEGGNRG